MIERLADRLRDVDPALSAEDLADVLWIARLLDPPDARADPAAGGPDRAKHVPDANEAAGPALDDATGTRPNQGTPPPALDGDDIVPGSNTYSENGDQSVRAPQEPSGSGTEAGLFIPDYLEGGEPSFPVRVPTLPALPHTLAIARALRPLRLAVPSPRPGHLNEERTATRFADTLIWEPQLDPATERRFEMVLVVDIAPSMVVWRHTSDELRLLLERLGAFRDVRIRYLDTDTDLRTHAELPDVVGGGTGQWASGRRIVLVVSDCIGAAWQDGRAAALLERWGRFAAVAIVQPLPQRLWRRCAAATERVWLRTDGMGTSNAGLSVRMRERHASRPPGVPVPVLELDRRWLEPWAAMVAGSGREIPGMALFTGRPTVAPPPPREPPAIPLPASTVEKPTTVVELSARERVMRFRASASPKAVELAGYLAAAPLRLPVMRLVQGTMMPGSTPAHLAEVFLSGLLRVDDTGAPRKPSDSGASKGRDPSEVAYEFHDGVRDVLLSGLRRNDALVVLREVWGTVRDRLGSSLDFPALLAAVRQNPDVLPPDQPFAQVATGVLARLGGTYGEVARRLSDSARKRDLLSPNNGNRDAGHNGNGRVRVQIAKERTELPSVLVGLPQRNPGFHGRTELISRVRESLPKAAVTVLSGVSGGEGKTEIAVELTHARLHEYDLVWWMPAADVRSVRASLAALARRLGTPLSDDVSVTIANLLQALRNGLPDGGRWLLVYDDACDLADLTPLIPLNSPASSGDVLVTSRDRRWHQIADTIEVGPFTRPESVSLLQARMAGLPEDKANGLAEALDDRPAALVQAAVHLCDFEQDPDDYLRLFTRRLPEFGDDRYATALAITMDGLLERDPVGDHLLKLASYLGHEAIRSDLPGPLSKLREDEAALLSAMRTLGRLELGRFDPDSHVLQVARYVRESVRDPLSGTTAARMRKRVHAMLSAATPASNPEDETTHAVRTWIRPHLVPSGILDADDTDSRAVVVDQARFLFRSGDFEGCRVLAAEAVSRWRAQYGDDDPLVLDAAGVLTNALYASGRPEQGTQARSLAEEILRNLRNARGLDDPSILLATGHLGGGQGLRYQGDFLSAHELDDAIWKRTQQRYGGDHSTVLHNGGRVATGLHLLGRFHEALELDTLLLDRLRGPHDDRTISNDIVQATHHLAMDLHALGRYDEALHLYDNVLSQALDVLGRDSAIVLHAQRARASTLRKAGRLTDAARLAEQTVEGHLRRFGAHHPATFAAKMTAALAGVAAGAPGLGRVLAEESLAGYRATLGDDHPFTNACAIDLAVVIRAVGDVQGALDLDRNALTALRQRDESLGHNHYHYYTLCGTAGIANDLYLLGELQAAYDHISRARDGFQARHGPNHPYTLACTHNLAVIGRATDTETPDAAGLGALSRLLGEHHPEVRAAARDDLLDCDIDIPSLQPF